MHTNIYYCARKQVTAFNGHSTKLPQHRIQNKRIPFYNIFTVELIFVICHHKKHRKTEFLVVPLAHDRCALWQPNQTFDRSHNNYYSYFVLWLSWSSNECTNRTGEFYTQQFSPNWCKEGQILNFIHGNYDTNLTEQVVKVCKHLGCRKHNGLINEEIMVRLVEMCQIISMHVVLLSLYCAAFYQIVCLQSYFHHIFKHKKFLYQVPLQCIFQKKRTQLHS